MRISYFGDSYSSPVSKWIQRVEHNLPHIRSDIYGKGGSNLFYSIDQWNWQIKDQNVGDMVIWTLTWHHRLFSYHRYRNEQFCAFNELRSHDQEFEPDPAIKTSQDNQEFLHSLKNYHRFLYEDAWRRFDHDLEIRWVMERVVDHADKKFIFIPNTQFSRECARRHFQGGILLDFAFEELSNRETGSPGPMPINCGRWGHLNDHNHDLFGDFMSDIISRYDSLSGQCVPVDLSQFDIER